MNDFSFKDPKSLIALFVIVFVLIAIPLTVISLNSTREPNSQAANTTAIYLQPASANVNVNGNLDVQVRENSGTAQVTTADITLTYDATKLDLTAANIDAASTSNFTSDAVAPSVSGGTISIVRFVPQPTQCPAGTTPPCPAFLTGDKLIATLHFKAKTVAGATAVNVSSTSIVYGSSGSDETSTRTGGTYTVVDTPPTISITSPAANSFQKGNFTAVASATDNLGVTRVDFAVDGGAATSDTTPDPGTSNYSTTISTASLTQGNHTLTAKAFDANCTTACPTASTTFTFDNSVPTAVTITSPAKVNGSVTISATATDTNLDQIDFKIDSGATTTDNSSPYQYTWNTTTATNASHTITATAFDKAGNSTVATQSVTVDNQGPSAPVLTISVISQSEIDLSWTASTDSQSLPVTYDVYRNGTKVNSSSLSTTTFQDTGLSASTSYSYVIRAKDSMTVANTTDSNTATATTKAPPKVGDINGDGAVNSQDLAILIATWASPTDLRADINSDGKVSSADLALLISRWGT